MSVIAKKAASKVFAKHVAQYEPEDPYYQHSTDARGKKTRSKRPVPPGLSPRDERLLKKIRKRAHYLDKGMNLCGFRVGWTFFIGIIPGAGDVANALLNYTLVVKPSKKLEIPDDLLHKLYFNNAVSAGIGFVPLVGDVALAVWKANSRNAHLVEAFLVLRGQEALAAMGQGPSAIPANGLDGADAAAIRSELLGHGAGYGATGTSSAPAGGMRQQQPQQQQYAQHPQQQTPGRTGAAPALPARR